jgi:Peptidase family S41/PDZ domain
MYKSLISTLVFCCFLPLQAENGDTATQEAMIQDLESVKYAMKVKYAPKEWKKEHLGWELEESFAKAKEKVYQNKGGTSKDFKKILKSFLSSTQDYHVKPLFYSTEWSVFPITLSKIEEKYYIASFETDITPSFAEYLFSDEIDPIENAEQYERLMAKLQIGDELIAINGIPVKDVIEKKLNASFGGNHTESAQALALETLFYSRGLYGEEVPSGTFEITIKHAGVARTSSYRLPWLHIPEKVMNKTVSQKQNENNANSPNKLIERYLKRDFTVHYAKEIFSTRRKMRQNGLFKKEAPSQEGEGEESVEDGREKGFLPELGEILWESSVEGHLYGYLYKNEKGQKIGYLYLPTFSYGEEAEQVLAKIIEIIKYFTAESEALVLDITNNPGGNLFYMYGVLSVLTDKPLNVPSEREILIQEDVYRSAIFAKLMEGIDENESFEGQTLWGYPFTHSIKQGIINYCHQIISAWESGKTLTDPLYCFGIEQIMPHPEVHYQKPLLLLINELDFSCADFFPAIMQDNGRATLFGNTTAGAGGYVNSYSHTSQFGVMGYTLTGSIAFRPDGNPIENLGVKPHIFYKPSKQDIIGNYANYINAVNKEVQQLIQ